MPSDKSTVTTKADFIPKVVGRTDSERSIASSAPRAHDGTSPQPRPEVHQTQFNVLVLYLTHPTGRHYNTLSRRSWVHDSSSPYEM